MNTNSIESLFAPFSMMEVVQYILDGLDAPTANRIREKCAKNSNFELTMKGLRIQINTLIDLEIVEEVANDPVQQAQLLIAHFEKEKEKAALKIFGEQGQIASILATKKPIAFSQNGHTLPKNGKKSLHTSTNFSPPRLLLKKEAQGVFFFLKKMWATPLRFAALLTLISGLSLGILFFQSTQQTDQKVTTAQQSKVMIGGGGGMALVNYIDQPIVIHQ